jgi:hypothetical protein
MEDLPRHHRHRQLCRAILGLSAAFAVGRSLTLPLRPMASGGWDIGRWDDFSDIRATTDGSDDDDDAQSQSNVILQQQKQERRTNCQIVYVLGVEGSMHHGFMPVLKSLAERQSDGLAGGMMYDVMYENKPLHSAIFKPLDEPPYCDRGGSEEDGGGPCDVRSMSNQGSVRSLLKGICPNRNDVRKRHVFLEDTSFPSGNARQRKWNQMSAAEIANSIMASNHPTNLNNLYDSFGPFVDVRFVVLHRPYLETIASHPGFDGGPVEHSVVMSGFITLLSRFLSTHMYSAPSRDGRYAPLWTIVCTDRLTSKSFRTEEELLEARASVLRYLANFLGWPVSTCPDCFDGWKESTKGRTPRERFGDEATDEVLVHAKMLEAIWPPRRTEDFWPEQQCGIL